MSREDFAAVTSFATSPVVFSIGNTEDPEGLELSSEQLVHSAVQGALERFSATSRSYILPCRPITGHSAQNRSCACNGNQYAAYRLYATGQPLAEMCARRTAIRLRHTDEVRMACSWLEML